MQSFTPQAAGFISSSIPFFQTRRQAIPSSVQAPRIHTNKIINRPVIPMINYTHVYMKEDYSNNDLHLPHTPHISPTYSKEHKHIQCYVINIENIFFLFVTAEDHSPILWVNILQKKSLTCDFFSLTLSSFLRVY